MKRIKYRSDVPLYPWEAFPMNIRAVGRLRDVEDDSKDHHQPITSTGNLLRISLVENACESYTPQGIDLGGSAGTRQVRSAMQQERQLIHLRDSTGGQRSLFSVLRASRVVFVTLAKAACHLVGQPVAPSISAHTSTGLRADCRSYQ
jgi:hypothetical protein